MAGNTGLGDRLYATRRKRGVSPAQLAEALDVSVETIVAWERSQSQPTKAQLEELASALGEWAYWLETGVEG
jgi:transcriptional regulator with XRE-family HTH domain